jgi:hypothetical protein
VFNSSIKQQLVQVFVVTSICAMQFGVPFFAFILLFAVLGYAKQIPSEKWKGDPGIAELNSENEDNENQNETLHEFGQRKGKTYNGKTIHHQQSIHLIRAFP